MLIDICFAQSNILKHNFKNFRTQNLKKDEFKKSKQFAKI